MFVQLEIDGARKIAIVAPTRDAVNASHQLSTHATAKQCRPYLGEKFAKALEARALKEKAAPAHDEWPAELHPAADRFRAAFPGDAPAPWRVDSDDPPPNPGQLADGASDDERAAHAAASLRLKRWPALLAAATAFATAVQEMGLTNKRKAWR